MLCSKCLHDDQQESRVRYTPTYYHHPIFQQSPVQERKNAKCTATYHSTVFNQEYPRKNSCQNANRNLNHGHDVHNLCNQPHQNQAQGCIHNQEISFNPKSAIKQEKAGNPNPITHHSVLWYDQQKQVQLKQCSEGDYKNLSKDRKLLEMSSCAFYGINQKTDSKNEENPQQCPKEEIVKASQLNNEYPNKISVQEGKKIENKILDKAEENQIQRQVEFQEPKFEQRQQDKTQVCKKTSAHKPCQANQIQQKANHSCRCSELKQKSFENSKVNCMTSTVPKFTGAKNTKITHGIAKRSQPVFRSVAVPRTK